MPIALTILFYALNLLPSIVTGVQAIAGEAASGTDKAQMAKDALTIALQGAASVFPSGSVNGTLANAAGAVVSEGIDLTSQIASVVSHLTKPNGAMQAAYNVAKRTGALAAATTTVQAPATHS